MKAHFVRETKDLFDLSFVMIQFKYLDLHELIRAAHDSRSQKWWAI